MTKHTIKLLHDDLRKGFYLVSPTDYKSLFLVRHLIGSEHNISSFELEMIEVLAYAHDWNIEIS